MGTEYSQSVDCNRTSPVCNKSMSVRPKNRYSRLHFHDVHGENIKLFEDKTIAVRAEGFCNGIVFSDRPVTIREPVYVKFLETEPNWHGSLRFGFTMNDPMSLKSKLPRYVCPGLTKMPGNWAKPILEKYAKKGSVLYYFVDQCGDVHYGIDSKEHGIIFGGVNTSGKLWAVLDIYGNSVAVEFLDPNSVYPAGTENCYSNSVSFQTEERVKCKQYLQSLSFHSIHGKNVTLKRNKTTVSRKAGTNSLAYAFTECPIEIGATIIMVVAETNRYCEELLVYGLTSCDPKKINPRELPENVYDLLDCSEYWVVKEKWYPFKIGDTITFTMIRQGLVEVTVNDHADPILHVDCSQPLWVFINLAHSISELNLTGACSNSEYDLDDISLETLKYLKITDESKVGFGNPSIFHEESSSKCVICCDEQINCALYRCGHMCMCYPCALKMQESNSGANCPICRERIQDIIKTYK